jgi:hypothetical protein
MDQEGKKIKFFFQKSNLFRVVHADGAWGGLTPDLQIFFSLFNTRPPIPQILGQAITPDGQLGAEIPEMTVVKDGILREVEVGVMMSPENVQALIDFLQTRVEAAKEIRSRMENQKAVGSQKTP